MSQWRCVASRVQALAAVASRDHMAVLLGLL
jgi:hypothetical protein